MKKHTLAGQIRDVRKQKPNFLRRQGLIPATVYGKKIKSESLSVRSSDLANVYKEAHETGLVELNVGGIIRPVLMHHVQKNPVKDTILHVEFHQVDLKEKVKAAIPVVLVGEAPAVVQKLGVILSLVSEVEVEALPTDLPEKLELPVSSLAAVDQELRVADMSVPRGVTLVTDESLVVVKVGALVSKAAEEQAAVEAAAAASETASATGEGESTKRAEPASEQPAQTGTKETSAQPGEK